MLALKFMWVLEKIADAKDPLSRLTDIELQTSDRRLLDLCEELRHQIAHRRGKSEELASGRAKVRHKKKAHELPDQQDSKQN